LPAHPKARTNAKSRSPHQAVEEACAALERVTQAKLARVTRAYFAGLDRLLVQLRRVLMRDAPSWLVIGGARLKDVYVPSDSIVAEIASGAGFEVERIVTVRRVIAAGRKFGRLANVAPRESIVMLRSR
jgi:hypothetical protein